MASTELDVEAVVVGAGAVGLACTALLARHGRSVIVLERNTAVGQETSSRNSGVIHAGLYYPVGSNKALTCVRGRELLYARCERDAVPHRRCGKLLVASEPAEQERLEAIRLRGLENGAGALTMVGAEEVTRRAPAVRAIAGLWSPETGIVDAHGLMDSYRAEARAHGAELVVATRLEGMDPLGSEALRLSTRDEGGETFTITTRFVVNAAGLDADAVAAMAGLDVDALGYRLHYCKGDYFALSSRFRGASEHLIYPVPVAAGLGIHLTMDLGGKLTAGPDTEYVDRIHYDVDPAKAAVFARAVRRYLPELRDEDLTPDYAGIRPKLQAPGAPVADFVIERADRNGVPGLINLVGIESPGLTASEAIAERVVELTES
ncbi:MAG: NAD(P)/FAD-dependent oxidoreductase [Myxococcales bacterium]|nr:NAD(P)/FAD-dependent oxidoreductase [Myxococcales bacterium]